MTKTDDSQDEFSPEQHAEAEEAAAWLQDRITERLAEGRVSAADMKLYLREVLSMANLKGIIVEPGDVPGSLRIIVPDRLVEVLAAFRAAGNRQLH